MKVEVEIDDKGEFVGTPPTELDAILKRIEATAHGTGYGKGAQKAAGEAKQQIADAIKAEKLKLEMQAPLERQKFAEIDDQNKLLKTQLETTLQESRKQLTSREEAHAEDLTRRVDAMNKRDAKIKSLVNAHLKSLASSAGARDESLGELEVILQHRIGYTVDMEPFVKGEDGEPAKTSAGNALGLDVFVKQYLDNHPHHRKATPGVGGNARGGASLRGTHAPASADVAGQRIDAGDRSPEAINDYYNATRKKTA